MSFGSLLASADRAALATVGAAVRYAPSSGAPVDVVGIFDAAYVRVDGGGHLGVVSSGPAVFLRLEDLPSDPEEDAPAITVDGVSYSVKDPSKDGQGGVLLRLFRND
jgi:hypothetical protein